LYAIFSAVWVVTIIKRLKTVLTLLMLNNVQRAANIRTTIVDLYAKPLLHYWPKTTVPKCTYGKIF